jgi:hypothetical protein
MQLNFSGNPSYLMNATLSGEHVLPVALIGRVPCRVTGTICRGDLLVSSQVAGVATVLDPDQYRPGCVIGKALQDHHDTGECMIVIYKNGAEHRRSWNQSGTAFANTFWTMSISSLVYANGTGDYFEIYAQQSSGANRTVQNAGSGTISWFNGCMSRGG